MLDKLGVYLEAVEVVFGDKKPRVEYVPITDKFIHVKIRDLPTYFNMDKASFTVTYGKHYSTNASTAILYDGAAGDITVGQYTIFSIMESLYWQREPFEREALEKMDIDLPDDVKRVGAYKIALERLSRIFDPKVMEHLIDKIRSFTYLGMIYDYIDELGILQKDEDTIIPQYKDETIENYDGTKCKVLDVTSLDFYNGLTGRKKTETLVLKAKGGEEIITTNGIGAVEAKYTANLGDAIFCNSESDIYVPRDRDGNAFKFSEIGKYGYDIVTGLYRVGENDAVIVKSNRYAKILKEIIVIPTCIKNAFGEGAHQFLFEGATLKRDLETGMISGIDKKPFDNTWETIPNEGKILK